MLNTHTYPKIHTTQHIQTGGIKKKLYLQSGYIPKNFPKLPFNKEKNSLRLTQYKIENPSQT